MTVISSRRLLMAGAAALLALSIGANAQELPKTGISTVLPRPSSNKIETAVA